MPNVSSENRKYVPIGYLKHPCIPSNATSIIDNCPLWLFGLLTSQIHMVWLRDIGGKLKSDYRYSIDNVYNTFPFPNLSKKDKDDLGSKAQAILDARKLYPESTLADLYNVDAMPEELSRAHKAVDRAVDRMYQKARFGSEHKRLAVLLDRHAAITAP